MDGHSWEDRGDVGMEQEVVVLFVLMEVGMRWRVFQRERRQTFL